MWARREQSARGFTLIEMLVVIAIIAILIALLLPTLAAARRNARVAATKATMHNLKISLENYHMEYGIYPIKPGGSGRIFDNGSGPYNPGYFQVPCVGLGAAAGGTEDNKDLIKILLDTRFLDVNKANIVNGQLMDHFGVPIIARFLVLPPGGSVTVEKLTEKLYIWSYGPDKVNGVNASVTYVNTGLPAYDTPEAALIDASPPDTDDVTIWR